MDRRRPPNEAIPTTNLSRGRISKIREGESEYRCVPLERFRAVLFFHYVSVLYTRRLGGYRCVPLERFRIVFSLKTSIPRTRVKATRFLALFS